VVGGGEGAILVATVGARRLRRAVGGASYLSQSSRTVHFGLGDAEGVEDLEVRWAGGGVDHYRDLAAGRVWEVREGDEAPRPVGDLAAGAQESADASAGSRAKQIEFWEVQRAAVLAMKRDGDIARAAEGFRKALALDPSHEDSLYYLGNCLRDLGDDEGALAALRRLTDVNPSSHRGWLRWAAIRAATAASPEDLAEAAAALDRALKLNIEETGALVLLAEVEILQGKLDDAEQRLEWACRSNPKAVGGFFLLGYVAWKRGDLERAAERLASARDARGPGWKPAGTAAEGDVRASMHRESNPLAPFWEGWAGPPDDLAAAFDALDAHLVSRRREISGG
jgi:tetratricopeptide (TPR) repeat protein